MQNRGELIEAIHQDRLAEVDDPDARAVCGAIGRRVASEVEAAITHLRTSGMDASPVGELGAAQQRHAAGISVADTTTALAAADALIALGYRPWEPIAGAARSVHGRFRSELTLAKTTDLTMALTLRWPAGAIATSTPDSLKPNANDFDTLSLPTLLWPLYFLLRPARLVAERLGLRPQSNRALGPFLSTPDSLIGPLLDLGDIGPNDVVVDLGCGDGRIVRAAATRYGCRAIGIESDPVLAQQAQLSASDKVQIINGDAVESISTVTDEATVYFVFVPAHAASELVKSLLRQAQPGAVIIAHEQHPLPDPPSGVESFPLFTDQGVTVAHRWTAG